MIVHRYLNHVTLDTGHSRRSPRDEVAESALEKVGAHLRRAVAAESDPILDTGYILKASSGGPFLLASILRHDGLPLLTFGVAPRARGAVQLWLMLVADRDYPVERGQPPSAPWCAVRLDDPLASVAISRWAADYERLIAWAWIEGAADA